MFDRSGFKWGKVQYSTVFTSFYAFHSLGCNIVPKMRENGIIFRILTF
jgi:hypothetical protein